MQMICIYEFGDQKGARGEKGGKNSENKVSDLIKIIMWALICVVLQWSKLKVI